MKTHITSFPLVVPSLRLCVIRYTLYLPLCYSCLQYSVIWSPGLKLRNARQSYIAKVCSRLDHLSGLWECTGVCAETGWPNNPLLRMLSCCQAMPDSSTVDGRTLRVLRQEIPNPSGWRPNRCRGTHPYRSLRTSVCLEVRKGLQSRSYFTYKEECPPGSTLSPFFPG